MKKRKKTTAPMLSRGLTNMEPQIGGAEGKVGSMMFAYHPSYKDRPVNFLGVITKLVGGVFRGKPTQHFKVSADRNSFFLIRADQVDNGELDFMGSLHWTEKGYTTHVKEDDSCT